MNSGSATVHFVPEADAWLCTGVNDNGMGDQQRFFGEKAKERATEYAVQNFKRVTVVERV